METHDGKDLLLLFWYQSILNVENSVRLDIYT